MKASVGSSIVPDREKAELPYYQPTGSEIQLFEHAERQHLPVLIKGPTGSGKTRFVSHMAVRLGRPLYTIACHDDLTAADLVGRYLIGTQGTFWADGPLTRAVREGAICYLDEVVEARKDTTVVLHPLADDRRQLPLDRTGELLTAAPGFMLVVSYNPGYQHLLKGLKPSTRQRFVALHLDYPCAADETRIIEVETGVDTAIAAQLVALGNGLRKLQDYDLEAAASTRLLVYTAKLIVSGMPAKQACYACLAEPLSDDREAVGALRELCDMYFGEK